MITSLNSPNPDSPGASASRTPRTPRASRSRRKADRREGGETPIASGNAIIVQPGMMIRDGRDGDIGTVVEVFDHQCVYANSKAARVNVAWDHVSALAAQPKLPAGYVMNLQEATADPFYRMSNELLVFMNRMEQRLGQVQDIHIAIGHLEEAFEVLMNCSNHYRGAWIDGELRDMRTGVEPSRPRRSKRHSSDQTEPTDQGQGTPP